MARWYSNRELTLSTPWRGGTLVILHAIAARRSKRASRRGRHTQVDRTLQLIRSTGCKSGLVFNPATPLDILKYVMDKVDIILLMSVNPGFGGQALSRAA